MEPKQARSNSDCIKNASGHPHNRHAAFKNVPGSYKTHRSDSQGPQHFECSCDVPHIRPDIRELSRPSGLGVSVNDRRLTMNTRTIFAFIATVFLVAGAALALNLFTLAAPDRQVYG